MMVLLFSFVVCLFVSRVVLFGILNYVFIQEPRGERWAVLYLCLYSWESVTCCNMPLGRRTSAVGNVKCTNKIKSSIKLRGWKTNDQRKWIGFGYISTYVQSFPWASSRGSLIDSLLRASRFNKRLEQKFRILLKLRSSCSSLQLYHDVPSSPERADWVKLN